MNACNPFTFDAGRCAQGALDGFILRLADWYFSLPTLAVVALAVVIGGIAYRQGGWPAVVAWAVGFGFLWGRRGTETHQETEHVAPGSADASPAPRRTTTKPGQKYTQDENGFFHKIKGD